MYPHLVKMAKYSSVGSDGSFVREKYDGQPVIIGMTDEGLSYAKDQELSETL